MTAVDHTHAKVVGYTDRLSVRPGDRLAVHASATVPDARVRVVRLGHDGTAPTRTPVAVEAPERVAIPHQDFDHGSYGLVPRPPAPGAEVTFAVWVWPTADPGGRVGLLSQGDADEGPHVELALLPDRTVRFAVRAENGVVEVEGPALHLRRWYLLVGGYGPDGLRLEVRPGARVTGEETSSVATAPGAGALVGGQVPLLLGARFVDGDRVGHFDGKLDGPTVFGTALIDVDEHFRDTATAWQRGAKAHWDLFQDIGGDKLLDVIGGHHGTLHNQPLRGVTGHDWTGEVLDWRFADRGYAAVHFHSDDLSDCGWEPLFTVEVPEGLPTGVYAVELATDEGVDRLPFFVRPAARQARLALLIPTLSYLAYALDHLYQPGMPEDPAEYAAPFARANSLHSMYDRHSDGSGVATASLLRPLLGMRDDHVLRATGCVHQLSEDLFLVGWLDRQGVEYDILTDHDLDAEGATAFEGYSAVITGSHPEYWSRRMLDGIGAHLDGGGHLGYLGGNGAYWVTAIHPERRHLAELRRGYVGVRCWESEPGELTLTSTAEPGGLWQERGRAPHRLFGIGTAAAGLTTGGAYEIQDVDHPFLDGIDRTKPLGAFGAVLGGAASFETCGIDALLGSPPGVTLLARAMLGGMYISGDTGPAIPHPLGDPVDRRRSDMTVYTTTGGGEVFSTGSIGWCGALSYDGDDNDVSRLTANVLRSWGVGPAKEEG
ncbi:large subunit of N,N-dimethylformamidase [Saccharothrix violaceirubra]|uniref:N,N-dimethylformamidase n=1 Tax=Saccharothrix violaceirubra TaxID=413306 RepID=A0A7W7T288_9PSEU|nr:N,N-dimethylformamidase beta subunit family domain-containing protein [Saccharothrix violaceirubra]MBB4965257.1 N,N-dimethylformamidase [Saccharothrix violaceirubra]